jgi:hypothetical protein
MTCVDSVSMDGLFTWNRIYDPPRVLFGELRLGGLLAGVNIPERVHYHSPVYYEIEYMALYL